MITSDQFHDQFDPSKHVRGMASFVDGDGCHVYVLQCGVLLS